MNGHGHRLVTEVAFDVLAEIGTNTPGLPDFLQHREVVAQQAVDADYLGDLEFVDVEGIKRDDPHDRGPGHLTWGMTHTNQRPELVMYAGSITSSTSEKVQACSMTTTDTPITAALDTWVNISRVLITDLTT